MYLYVCVFMYSISRQSTLIRLGVETEVETPPPDPEATTLTCIVNSDIIHTEYSTMNVHTVEPVGVFSTALASPGEERGLAAGSSDVGDMGNCVLQEPMHIHLHTPHNLVSATTRKSDTPTHYHWPCNVILITLNIELLNYYFITPYILTWVSENKQRRALCTFSLIPRVGIISLSQSGPGAEAKP